MARGDATRKTIIEATARVIAEVGYSHTTIRVIADAAGVAEGTIYVHFRDKSELFFAALSEKSGPVLEWMEHLPELAGRSTVRQNLVTSLGQLALLRHDVIPLELALQTDPELAQLRHEALRTEGVSTLPGPPGHLARYLLSEQELGRLRKDVDPDKMAMVLLVCLFGLGTMPSAEEGVDLTLIETTVDLLLRGARSD